MALSVRNYYPVAEFLFLLTGKRSLTKYETHTLCVLTSVVIQIGNSKLTSAFFICCLR